MACKQEGGVRTQKLKATMMAFAVLAMAAVCFVGAEDYDADFYDINGEKNVIGTGDSADYTIVYTNNDFNDRQNMNMEISYSASLKDSSGTTVSSGVSPSSGNMNNGVAKTLTVTAPRSAGNCTLTVKYTISVSYTETDDDGKEVTKDEELTREDSYTIHVVNPITLSVTLSNERDVPLEGYGVYFVVDGERIDDSYQTITLGKNGETTVTYKWITDSGNGKHSFQLEAADGGNMVSIEGLGEEHTFYIGDNSYTWVTALLVLVIILLLFVMVWVYRKPVKNYGKPKSRR